MKNTQRVILPVFVMSIMFILVTISVFAQPAEKTLTCLELIQAGAEDAGSQNYDDARLDYAEAAKLAHTDAEKATIKFSIATIDLAQQKFEEAESGFSQIIEDKTTPIRLIISAKRSLGTTYVARGKYDKARSTFRELAVSKDYPDMLKVMNQISIAQTYVAEKKFVAAQLELGKINNYSRTVPSASVTSAVWSGRFLVFEGKWNEGRSKFADALRIKSDEFSEVDKQIISLYQDFARLEDALSYARQGTKDVALVKLQTFIERPKVEPQVLAEAKKQLKLLQPDPKTASVVK